MFRQQKARFLLYERNKLKQRKQILKQHKTARSYRSAHVIDLKLKTWESKINIL